MSEHKCGWVELICIVDGDSYDRYYGCSTWEITGLKEVDGGLFVKDWELKDHSCGRLRHVYTYDPMQIRHETFFDPKGNGNTYMLVKEYVDRMMAAQRGAGSPVHPSYRHIVTHPAINRKLVGRPGVARNRSTGPCCTWGCRVGDRYRSSRFSSVFSTS